MTSDPTDGVSAIYDPENRIASAATPQGTFTYTYDADGNRVMKSNGANPPSGTLYWYMTLGIVAESDLAGNLKSEYVFFNGERVARRDFDPSTGAATGVFYYFSDHLKTASVITDAAGNITAESDYYPWGGELQFVNNDSNHYKFTGKERDSESGLDYFGARYYSNGLGRFITPDWAAKATDVPYAEFSDPQSLNLYTYVRNVPTTRYDPDGHFDDPFNVFGGGGLFNDSDGGSNIESSHNHMITVDSTVTKVTVHLPSLDNSSPGPTVTSLQVSGNVAQVGVPGSTSFSFTWSVAGFGSPVRYRTAQNAAIAALIQMIPISNKTGWEWGCVLYQNYDDSWSFTESRTDQNPTTVDVGSAPLFHFERGHVHTHPFFLGADPYAPSPADNDIARRRHATDYLGLFNGEIWRYDGVNPPEEIFQLLPGKTGAEL